MGNTLITGGGGFIGSALIEAIVNDGKNVIVADTKKRTKRLRRFNSNSQVELIESDKPYSEIVGEILPTIDNAIHLAWSSNPASSMNNIMNDAQNNILGTLRLLEACGNSGISKFIFASSGGTVYGNQKSMPLSESAKTEPLSAYGISKLACEKYVSLYSMRYGFSGINLRITNPYGPYQLKGTAIGVIARFINDIISKNEVSIFGDGSMVRDYLHIDDFTTAVLKILNYGHTKSDTYNLSYGSGTSISEILQMIEMIIGHEVGYNILEERRFDVREVTLDNNKFKKEFNWQPEVALYNGIEMMCSSSGLLTSNVG